MSSRAEPEEHHLSYGVHVWLTAAVAAMGGILFGYDTGMISGAQLYIEREFDLSSGEIGVVVSAVTAGALVGAFFSLVADGENVAARNRQAGGGRLHRRRGAGGGRAEPRGADRRPLHHRPRSRLRLDGRAALHLRGRASRQTRLDGGAVPARDHGRHPARLHRQRGDGRGVADRLRARRGARDAAVPRHAGAAQQPPLAGDERRRRRRPRGPPRAARPRRAGDRGRAQEIIDAVEEDRRRPKESIAAAFSSPLARTDLVVGIGLGIFQQITGINTIIYYAPTILFSAPPDRDNPSGCKLHRALAPAAEGSISP